MMGAALALLGCDDETALPDAGPIPDGHVPSVVELGFEELEIDGNAFTDIVWHPSAADEVLVASHPGEVIHYRIEGDRATRLGAFTVPEVASMGDCGLLAVAFDPDWATNHLVYAGHCVARDFATRITRLTWDGESYDVADSARTVLEVHEARGPYPFNHNISNILFEDDGTMVVGVGDKSAAGTVGQDPHSLASTVFRIVPNREPDGDGYVPAEGNPFTDPADGAPEVWAYGLRYPWRIARDPRRGWYFIGDVGEGRFEEVNVARTSATNFGWPECEGDCDPSQGGLVDPLLSYPHSEDHPYVDEDPETLPGPRRAVWVAPGRPNVSGPRLEDTFLFGDVCTGWVRGVTLDDDANVTEDRLLGHLPFVTAWVWSPEGVGYAITFGSCNADVPIEPAKLVRVVLRTE